MTEWPRNWNELTRGIGCEMCENGRPDANRYGVRIHAGRHTDELDDAEASGYPAEVLTVARALISVYKPLKMNYETLGNSLPHLHIHLIPRFSEDPHPRGVIRAYSDTDGNDAPRDDAPRLVTVFWTPPTSPLCSSGADETVTLPSWEASAPAIRQVPGNMRTRGGR